MSVRRATAVFVFLTAVGFLKADWQISNAQREPSPDGLVEHCTTTLEDPATGARATLHTAVFDTRGATLRVIDQPNPPRHALAEAMARAKALAGVNGGYFDPQDVPVGLLVSDGRTISPLRKAKLLTGVLFATGSRVDVVRASHFTMSERISSALQCGPLLVERGRPVAGLNDSHPAERTFAAVDGKGRAALGVSSAVTLAQVSRILCLTNAVAKIKIVSALNLDGGSSSAFWFAGRNGAVSIPEVKTVRDFVAIVPRPNR